MKTMDLPRRIESGWWKYGHCQGIALDTKHEYIYYSFTTALLKTDLNGNLVGSVTGLLGHLGCIDFCDRDGRLYGSLEYKNDAIGRGILKSIGSSAIIQNAFYIAIFDVEKIDRLDMDACTDGVMTTVYLRDVLEDYSAEVECNGKTVAHRHGCSGIDGTTFGRLPGSDDDTEYLFVAYGIYGDTERSDNDDQVILCYDSRDWGKYERPLIQSEMHTCGPEQPMKKLFVHTGNTTYGVQNLEYDASTGNFLMAVYRGKKPEYPNHAMYVIDGCRPVGLDGETERMYLLPAYESEGPSGWDFEWGSMGLYSFGNGLFYVAHGESRNGEYSAMVRLYRWDGVSPLVEVE